MTVNINTLNRLLIFTPLALSIILGLKSFEIWAQISYLWNFRASPVEELVKLSPHSFRYAAMYPIVVASEKLGIDENFFFSCIVLMMGFFTALLISASLLKLQNEKKFGNAASFFISTTIVLLLFNMNGRGAVALFGYALLVNIIVKSETGRKFSIGMLVNLFFALLCSSVSSGTLAVSCTTLLLYVLKNLRDMLLKILNLRFSKEKFKNFLVGLVCLITFLGMVLVGVRKNLDFYGVGYGGVVNMLSHGLGAVLRPLLDGLTLPLLIAIVVSGMVAINSIVKRSRYPLISRTLAITIMFGFFGYTTLSMAIVPLLVLLGSALPDFHVVNNRCRSCRKSRNRGAEAMPGFVARAKG